MAKFLSGRLLMLVPTLLGVMIVAFILVRSMPGDPVTTMLGLRDVPPERLVQLRAELGLDQPVFQQLGRYLGRVIRGDLGVSITSGQSALDLIGSRLLATFELAVAAMLLAIIVAVPIGVLAAVKPGSVFDVAQGGFTLLGISAPNYWVGLMLISGVSVNLGLLPASGYPQQNYLQLLAQFFASGDASGVANGLRYLVLPAVTLSLAPAAVMMKLVRSAMKEVLSQDYIRTARAKGITPAKVVLKHALRSSLVAVVTVAGLQFGALLGGAVITETIFAWPGIGRLTVQSVYSRDYPVVQTAILTFAVVRIALNLLVDLSYAVLDPRISYS